MNSYPDKWQTKKIEDIAFKPQYGYTASATGEPIGPKFLRITDIKDGHVNWGDVPYCLCEASGYDKYKLKQGDIVFARTGATTGKSYRIKEKIDSIFASYLIRIRTKKIVDSTYLSYVFDSDIYWRQINRLLVGSAQGGVNASVLSSLKVPVPPLVEQRGIVEVLGTVDECIRLTDAVIERVEELKRGLMQKVLTRGIGHTEFKDSPMGKIPNSWKIKKLGDVSQLIVPMRDKPKRFEGDIPWIRIDDFDGKFISKSKSSRNVSQKIINEMRLKPYPVGTVLCSCSCTMGICAITKSVLTSNQTFIGIYPNEDMGSEYLYYLMTHNAPNLKKLGSGTTIPYISRKKFSDLKISVPPKNEQEKISSILSEVDKLMEIYQGFRKKHETLKKGLMQILLTGKICVEMMEDGLHRIGDSREANN